MENMQKLMDKHENKRSIMLLYKKVINYQFNTVTINIYHKNLILIQKSQFY